jgi:hypothetical protein
MKRREPVTHFDGSAVAPAGDQKDALPASPAERIDFLMESIAFTESTIRAYDAKSQIALAAFVLSMNALWPIMKATCNNVTSRPIAIVLLPAFVGTILCYGFVLWPILPLQNLAANVRAKGFFVIFDPISAGSAYVKHVKQRKGSLVESELISEALKLAFIRARKGRCLKYALLATGVFYMIFLAAFLALRQCV